MNPWLMQGIGEENAAFVVGAVVLDYFIAKAGAFDGDFNAYVEARFQ